MVLRLQCDTAPRLVSQLKTILKHSANTSKVTAIHLPEKASTFSTYWKYFGGKVHTEHTLFQNGLSTMGRLLGNQFCQSPITSLLARILEMHTQIASDVNDSKINVSLSPPQTVWGWRGKLTWRKGDLKIQHIGIYLSQRLVTCPTETQLSLLPSFPQRRWSYWSGLLRRVGMEGQPSTTQILPQSSSLHTLRAPSSFLFEGNVLYILEPDIFYSHSVTYC